MLARLEATLTQSTAVEIDGHPGLSVKASIPERQIPGGVVEGVVYMVDARAYQVVAITAKGELYAGDRAAFLKSFQLLPRAAPTATAE
jgi:hypothetical protein